MSHTASKEKELAYRTRALEYGKSRSKLLGHDIHHQNRRKYSTAPKIAATQTIEIPNDIAIDRFKNKKKSQSRNPFNFENSTAAWLTYSQQNMPTIIDNFDIHQKTTISEKNEILDAKSNNSKNKTENLKKRTNKLDQRTLSIHHLPFSMEYIHDKVELRDLKAKHKVRTQDEKNRKLSYCDRKPLTALVRSRSNSNISHILQTDSMDYSTDTRTIDRKSKRYINKKPRPRTGSLAIGSTVPQLIPQIIQAAGIDTASFHIEQEKFGQDRENQLFYTQEDSYLRNVKDLMKKNNTYVRQDSINTNEYTKLIQSVRKPSLQSLLSFQTTAW